MEISMIYLYYYFKRLLIRNGELKDIQNEESAEEFSLESRPIYLFKPDHLNF